MSYVNLMMYNSVQPSYGSKKNKEAKVIDAEDIEDIDAINTFGED